MRRGRTVDGRRECTGGDGRPRCAKPSSSTAFRLARPVRSTDGRYVVAGWRADTFVTGTPEPRHDEVVSAAVRLHEATAKLERPRFLTQPPGTPWSDVDVFIAADRAAWEDRPLHALPPGALVAPGGSDGQRSVELINQLATLRRPTRAPSQLVHGDLYGDGALRGHRCPRHHRHHPILAPGIVGRRGGGGGRAGPGVRLTTAW